MNPDNRKHIAAFRPCGCVGILMTTEDPDMPYGGYKATAKEMASFYKDVHKAQKRSGKQLTIGTLEGRPDVQWECEKCKPSQTN